jgi:hypothetical protein
MWADEECALLIVTANLISALWSYFCIVASLGRYEFMRHEVVWVTIPSQYAISAQQLTEIYKYALWCSCQTYAFLVSLTNLGLLGFILVRVRGGLCEKLKMCRGRVGRVVGTLVLTMALVGAGMACFIPLKMTLVDIDRSRLVNTGARR